MTHSPTDRIEKYAVLRAPLDRVWRAVSDSAEFGAWFKARFHEPFAPGRTLTAEFTEPGYVGRTFAVKVEAVEPPKRLAFRWRPHEFDSAGDDFADSTLVEFLLEAHPEGTELRIVESGFDALPADQREAQYRGNDEGWAEQLERITNYVSGTDRIEKSVSIEAPIERVWRAISEADQFASWFGLNAAGARFEAGKPAEMKLAAPPEYAGMPFTIDVVSVEAGRYFAFRWHPYAVDPGVDYSGEATTLVEFLLEATGDSTLLTLTESGFNAVPEHRRATAFEMNDHGWGIQVQRVKEYVGG